MSKQSEQTEAPVHPDGSLRLTPNQRLAVRAHWQKNRVVWGVVVQDYFSGSEWMLKHGGLTESNFVFRADGDGHSRLVKRKDIVG